LYTLKEKQMLSTFSRLTGGSTAQVSAALFAEMTGGGTKRNNVVDVRVPISSDLQMAKNVSDNRRSINGGNIISSKLLPNDAINMVTSKITGAGKTVDIRVPVKLTNASLQISRSNPNDISLEPTKPTRKKHRKKILKTKQHNNTHESIKNKDDI
jgi:hypothetical protein